jgi:hypothetical protein
MILSGSTPASLPIAMLALSVLALLIGPGCASTTIDTEGPVELRPLPQPVEILVYDFAFRKDQVSPESALGARLYDLVESESKDERQDKVGSDVAKKLSETIVAGLQSIGLKAQRVPHGSDVTAVPAIGILKIEGQFMDVDAGNRLRRVAIGLGIGKSKLATNVQIFDAMPEGDILVQSFSTTARSDLKPGAVEMIPAGGIATGVNAGAGVALEVADISTLHGDAKRTGKLIVRHLAALAYQRGWITYEQATAAHADISE